MAFFDSSSKVNIIYLIFAKELDLSIGPIDIGAQKIDGIMLDIYRMVVVAFSMMDKANQVRFLEETFLLDNVSLEVVPKMFFLTLSSVDVDFLERELR